MVIYGGLGGGGGKVTSEEGTHCTWPAAALQTLWTCIRLVVLGSGQVKYRQYHHALYCNYISWLPLSRSSPSGDATLSTLHPLTTRPTPPVDIRLVGSSNIYTPVVPTEWLFPFAPVEVI